MFLSVSVCLAIGVVIALHLAVIAYLTHRPKKSIRGKHVVVTGGSDGIGRAVAIRAAQLGADVTIIARDMKKLGESIK